jgi:mitogen-activated protein kinase 15
MSEEVESHILERYEIIQKLGKGAYGIVWKAMDKKYKQVVALKKVFEAFRNSTDAQRTYREVVFLQDLGGHDNIVRLRNIIRAENNMDLYLVFEYMEADLHLVIRASILEDVHRQYIIYQLLKALKYVHSAGLIHRDLKPANILINSDVMIKVADFGLARSVAFIGDDGDYKLSEYVATRWYRAPEILLGSSKYSKAVDMWSVGCILGELLVGKPIFQGKSSLNQIEKVLELVGKPKSEDVESLESPHAETILNSLSLFKKKSFQAFFPDASEDALDLLRKLLAFNPNQRITIEEALKHKYVAQFSSPEEEIVCDHLIEIPLNDFTKLSTKEYREAIYAHIAKKKRERRRKLQERNVTNVDEKQQPPHFQPHQQQPQQFQQTQYHHMKSEKSVNVSQNQSQNQSQNPIQSHSQSQSQSQSQLMSKSHAQSPSHSRNQPYGAANTSSGVKIRPSRAYERSMSNMTKTNTTLSSSLIGYDEKAGSPLLEKKVSQANAKSRPMYNGKTEGDIQDQSGFKQSSVSPQRVPIGRKTYYMGGSHVNVKNILRSTNTGMSASKVLSTSGNSFILKKK